MTSRKKIDVAIAATKQERSIALRLAAKSAASRIAGRITFGFDDATTQPAYGQITNKRLSDEISRQLNRIDWEALPAESIDAALRKLHLLHHRLRTVDSIKPARYSVR